MSPSPLRSATAASAEVTSRLMARKLQRQVSGGASSAQKPPSLALASFKLERQRARTSATAGTSRGPTVQRRFCPVFCRCHTLPPLSHAEGGCPSILMARQYPPCRMTNLAGPVSAGGLERGPARCSMTRRRLQSARYGSLVPAQTRTVKSNTRQGLQPPAAPYRAHLFALLCVMVVVVGSY